jgi:hypothetical protein
MIETRIEAQQLVEALSDSHLTPEQFERFALSTNPLRFEPEPDGTIITLENPEANTSENALRIGF